MKKKLLFIYLMFFFVLIASISSAGSFFPKIWQLNLASNVFSSTKDHLFRSYSVFLGLFPVFQVLFHYFWVLGLIPLGRIPLELLGLIR